jgi:hypothetical protein
MMRKGKVPISPKKNIIYLVADGTLIPFGVIYTDDLLDTKLRGLDFEGKQRFRLLGFTNVRYTFGNNETRKVVIEGIIRTNLEFMLSKVPEGMAKTIPDLHFSKEGKTFVAANLAATFALSGKSPVMEWISEILTRRLFYARTGFTNYLSSDLEKTYRQVRRI